MSSSPITIASGSSSVRVTVPLTMAVFKRTLPISMNVDHQDLEACFSSNPENPETVDSMLKQAKITPGVTTYDPKRIDELFKASRGFYFAGDNGYLILIKLHGSNTCLKRYIPRAELPEWAK